MNLPIVLGETFWGKLFSSNLCCGNLYTSNRKVQHDNDLPVRSGKKNPIPVGGLAFCGGGYMEAAQWSHEEDCSLVNGAFASLVVKSHFSAGWLPMGKPSLMFFFSLGPKDGSTFRSCETRSTLLA